MDYIIEDLNISKKVEELELEFPTNNLAFFPENFVDAKTKSDFVFTDSMPDLSKIFLHDNQISVNALGEDTELYRSRKSADVYLPAMFFGLSLITENPTIVSVSLNVLSNYVYDLCKGSSGKKTAHVDLYIETKEKGIVKKISYKGDAEGLKDLKNIIKEMK
ncbi:hypothetical protein CMU40_14555 [Elizabethkingia anophelis]|nr:hypothetical protein [Elizabethkingia anophelis]MDV3727406.1 hypothetical protein [Elizabethkingia anophelis]MDV3728435.1 hypothetical protein [Elizabethkingia anophelis]MDV3743359.1 hypothetical protein [Elizabethkingia anophelis]MDV3767768.1 hypothetical protein [Elizabethkingia anophelis]